MAESPLNAQFAIALSPSLANAIQDRTLVRVFRDPLIPHFLNRGEAAAEKWPANLGDYHTFTRAGLIAPTTRPLDRGKDPKPSGYEIEQWELQAQQWAHTIDTDLPTSGVSFASTYMRNMQALGIHAGQSMNRVVRDKSFNAYTAGNGVVNGAVAGGVTVPVVSLNGFTHRQLNGRPALVSANNPLPVVITTGGVATAYNVVGFTEDVAGDYIHGGTLTLDVAHAGLADRDSVLAVNRSRVVNSGGGVTIDDISSADILSMADIRAAVAQLRNDNVHEHEDGTFHCHLDAVGEQQIFSDNEFQRLHQGLPDSMAYRELALDRVLNCTFFRNTESPLASTVNQDPEYGYTFAPEIYNSPAAPATSIEIHRAIVTGQGYLEERYLDQSNLLTEHGVVGKVGDFVVNVGGVQVMVERIRAILRAPLDRLQQLVSSSWCFQGQYGFPTDSLTGATPADFKRAVVLQFGA